jgi:hypothetical protein
MNSDAHQNPPLLPRTPSLAGRSVEGGGVQGSSRQQRKDSDTAITAAAAVALATSPAPDAFIKPNEVVEIYTAAISISVSGTPVTRPQVERAPASMEVKAVSSAEIPLDLWPSPDDDEESE